jgi:hypothetical protein
VNAARAMRASLFAATTLAVAACSGTGAQGVAPASVLGVAPQGPVVARVGGEAITAPELVAFAQRERIADPRAAMEAYVRLRLLARESLRRGGDAHPLVQDVSRRAQVQRLLELTVEQRVRESNTPAGALAHVRRTRGFALAHGELRTVLHAVVAIEPRAAAPEQSAARARAESIRAALESVGGTQDVAAVRAIAQRFSGPEEVRVEEVRGFDAQGANGTPQPIDPTFAAAAAALTRDGERSPVVRTPFGYHVMVLLRREPALEADPALVDRTVRAEALTLARGRELQQMLASMRTRYRVRIVDVTGASP